MYKQGVVCCAVKSQRNTITIYIEIIMYKKMARKHVGLNWNEIQVSATTKLHLG